MISHGIDLGMNKSFRMPAVRLLPSNMTSLTKTEISALKFWVMIIDVIKIGTWKYSQYDQKVVSMWLLELML